MYVYMWKTSDKNFIVVGHFFKSVRTVLLPVRASEQGNVIGSVRIYIRECGSTLYVGLARAVSPTNTNFRLTFLLTRLQEALYEGLAV